MEATIDSAAVATVDRRTWVARGLHVLLVAFLLLDAGMKIARAAPVLEATARMGFPVGAILPIGSLLLALTILYAVPRTRLVGAVLLTGYLGGAVATQVMARADPFAMAFPVLFGALVWVVPLLSDARLRSLLRGRGGAARGPRRPYRQAGDHPPREDPVPGLRHHQG